MPQSFNCPNCSAPLDLDGDGSSTLRCPYCQTSVIIPRELRVGNLYINRNNTGALVERQPFGGARMSGVGTKAGGPDYLLHFMDPRVITENTMRRGFAPIEEDDDWVG